MTKDKEFYKRFFVLTLTLALQNLVVFSVNFADNVMLGAYNENALSGVALVNQVQFLLQMLTGGIGEGMVVLGSQYWGKRQTGEVKKIVGIALMLGAGVALAMWSAAFFFPHGVLSLFTNDEAVIAEGMSYLQIVCFSYLFFSMTSVLLSSLRSVETVHVGFVVSVSTLLVNIFLNYALIFGHLGAPRLGVRGAAIATLAARAVELVIVVFYVRRVDKKLCLRFAGLFRLDGALLRSYARVALPVIAGNGLWGIAMGVQTSILGHMGGVAIAANSVATTVFQILTVVAYGSATASSILVGKTIGQGRIETVKEYARTLQVLYLCIGAATGLLLFVCRDAVLQLYAISPQSKELARSFMTVLSVTAVGTAYQMSCLTGIVRGGGDTKFVLFNDIIFIWGLVTPLSALSAFVWGLPPVFVFGCLKCDQILKCFVAVVKVNRFGWIRILTPAAQKTAAE